MKQGKFGLILYSKIKNQEALEIYKDNLKSFFELTLDSHLISSMYFVDDSTKIFQRDLEDHIKKLANEKIKNYEFFRIVDNYSIYNAINKVWDLVDTEYTISLHEDFRLIQKLPLKIIKKAFEQYGDVYLIYLRVRGLFGYCDSETKQKIKSVYPYQQVFRDDEYPKWYCYDKNLHEVYSLPYKLYLMQKKKELPKKAWGNKLVPRVIDENNTLWTPVRPSKTLPNHQRGHESFVGGPAIFRTSIVKKYLPLPKRYKDESPAECLEGYFLKTCIDCFHYTGYLNLQAFMLGYKDPERPLQNIEREYWDIFLENNSQPITHKDLDVKIWSNSEGFFQRAKIFFISCICCLRSFLRWEIENLLIFLIGKKKARKIKKIINEVWEF